jgi:arginine deiminase
LPLFVPSLDLSPARTLSSPVDEGDAQVHVASETALLERVLVHTPGMEMDLVSPENREGLLFEDILFTGTARREHELMCALFRTVTGRDDAVLHLRTLLAETFEHEEARARFVTALVEHERNLAPVQDDLLRLAPGDLLAFALTGRTELPVEMPPLPNLFFTRDLAATVHDRIVLGQAATAARAREGLLLRAVLRHHPAFAGTHDRLVELPPGVTFEGGDLLVPHPKVVLIGHSERTSFGGVMTVAHALFAQTPVEHVLAVELPQQRSCMHLDTVLTFAGPGECIVYPPLLERTGFGYVVHLTPTDTEGRFETDMQPNLRHVLQEVLEEDLDFIPCGGSERLHQAREQWTDGSNVFAIAPGVVVGYERNHRTFEELQQRGYRVADARSFLEYHGETGFTPGDEKIALKLEGTELSRGRGGPRCMTMPLARKAATGTP